MGDDGGGKGREGLVEEGRRGGKCATYSWVHCERTRRRVMEDLPHPPSPQMVMEILSAITFFSSHPPGHGSKM
jgi:hypothetical protein